MFKKIFFITISSLTLRANNLHQLIQKANQLHQRMQSIMQNIKEQVPDIDQMLAQKSVTTSIDSKELNQENIEQFIKTTEIITQQLQHLTKTEQDKLIYQIQSFYRLPQKIKTILDGANHITYEQQLLEFTQKVQHTLSIIKQIISSEYISMTGQTILQTILIKLGQQPTTINDLLLIPLLLQSYTTLKEIFAQYPININNQYQQIYTYLIHITHPNNPIIHQIHYQDTQEIEQIIQIIHQALIIKNPAKLL